MVLDIKEVLRQCYWAAKEYRNNPSDDYIIEKIVGFIDSNNLMADKYLASPKAEAVDLPDWVEAVNFIMKEIKTKDYIDENGAFVCTDDGYVIHVSTTAKGRLK